MFSFRVLGFTYTGLVNSRAYVASILRNVSLLRKSSMHKTITVLHHTEFVNGKIYIAN